MFFDGKLKQVLFCKLIICIVLKVLLTPTFAQAQYKTFSDDEKGYAIDYPSDWQVLKSQYADGGAHFVDTNNDSPVAVVNVNKINTTQNIAELAKSTQNYISSQAGVSEFSIISENPISVSGLKGVVKLIQYTLNENQSTVKSAFLGDGQAIITISMAGSKQVIDDLTSVYEHMLESIELL